jgi:uncharacterized protein YcaQ
LKRITSEHASRIALAAQGLHRPRPAGAIDRRHFRRLFRTIGLLQLDSVNVLERSHYLPVFSRLGAYDRRRLDEFTTDPREIFEYWGHAASLLPVSTYPLWRFRMDGMKPWRSLVELEQEHPGYVEAVYDEIAEHGPMTVSDLANPGMRTGPWWGYGRGKLALEWLFASGRITAWRNGSFGRVYDITTRVIPAEWRDRAPATCEASYRELLVRSGAHHGIGTAADLVDYYRLHGPTARPVLESLADGGELLRCEVPGWRGPVYLHPEATLPRASRGSALLSPFDPVVWLRERAERLFGFHYRIEIYVPEPDRVYGYYVLPFLLDGRLVGRVDLKSDRKARTLLVKGAYAEAGVDRVHVAAALSAELRTMAGWLGLDEISVARKGDLSAAVRAAMD